MAESGTSPSKHRLLIIDDEKDVLYSFKRVLAKEDIELLSTTDPIEGLSIFKNEKPDIVLMDVRMANLNGIEALREIRRIDPKAIVIIMTAYGSTQTAIEAMKAGAYDYILKPFQPNKIKELLLEAIASSDKMKDVVSYQPLLSKEDHAQGIIGNSEAMQNVYKEIGRVAAKNIPVLITGETGTGKELVTRAIYHHSDRSDKRFLAINCGAMPEQLLESEMFGHERGAFTGAHARKVGKFEVCDGGTLFLDEIGELSLATQTKLLRVLQEKEFERVGGSQAIKVDVRILAATHRDLREMIAQGLFREDLYYRLDVVSIRIPALRERRDDIPLLVEYFVERFSQDFGSKVTISEAALDKMVGYDWPGNVRQLENVIKNSLVKVKGQVLSPEDVELTSSDLPGGAPHKAPAPSPSPPAAVSGSASSEAAPAAQGPQDVSSLMSPVFQEIRRRREDGDPEDAFNMVERCLVRESLIHVKGNQARAAKLLGITRSTLRKRMAKYGIQLRTNIESEKH